MVNDFLDFIKKYNVLGLGLGVVIGTAAKDLVNVFVEDVLMPIISIILPGSSWREAVVNLWTVQLRIGHLIGSLLDFLLVALALYLFVRYVLHKEKVDKL